MNTSAREWVVASAGPDETLELGRQLGAAVEPATVLALIGPLGAGKTLLVRGVAEGLGIADPRAVSSPTFVLIQEYAARLPIYHFDTYRLTSPADFAALGPEEYFEGAGVSLVEWADRVADHLPADRLEIRFEVRGPTERTLRLTARGDRAARVLARLIARRPGP